jgi:O-antigen/teichoic acid export membrane protein
MAARWTLSLGLPFLGILIFAGDAVLGLYGPEFVVGATAAVTLAGANLINSVFGYAELVLLMAGLPYLNLANTILFVAVNAVGTVVLIPRLDILGPPVAVLVAFAFVNLIRLVQVRRFVGVHPFHGGLLKPLLAFAVGCAVGWAAGILPGVHDVAAAAAFVVVFVIARLALGLDPEERQMIRRLLRRTAPDSAD